MSQIVWVLEGAFSRERLVRPGEGRDPYRGIHLWHSLAASFAKPYPVVMGRGFRQDDYGEASRFHIKHGHCRLKQQPRLRVLATRFARVLLRV